MLNCIIGLCIKALGSRQLLIVMRRNRAIIPCAMTQDVSLKYLIKLSLFCFQNFILNVFFFKISLQLQILGLRVYVMFEFANAVLP